MKVPSIASFPSFGVSTGSSIDGRVVMRPWVDVKRGGVWAWVTSRPSSPLGDGEAYKLSLAGAV